MKFFYVFVFTFCSIQIGTHAFAKPAGVHQLLTIRGVNKASSPIEVTRFVDATPELTVICYVSQRYGQHAISCVKAK